MASVSVVGQHPAPHRLDSEPPLLLIKLSSAKKKISLPRRSSREKVMLRRSSGSGREDSATQHASPGLNLDPAAMPGEGRVAPLLSPQRGGKAVCADCDRRSRDGVTAGSAAAGSDCNSNSDTVRDLNRDTGGRKRRTVSEVTLSGGGAAFRATGRRSTWSSDGRHQGGSSPPSMPVRGESGGGVPLERVTQGRTGVVRLVRAEPPRREAWSIFPSRGLAAVDPRMKAERGEGHRFEAKPVTQDWCDACSRQITAQGLKCQNCNYTCHLECERRVQLDCNQRDKSPQRSSSLRDQRSSCSPSSSSSSSSSATALHKQNEAKEEEERGKKELSGEEVRTRIEEYNSQVSDNKMSMSSDGSYTGFIRVHLRLSRPVTVPSVDVPALEGGNRLAGGGSQVPSESHGATNQERTSFYLPSDCAKQLHISSHTTTREVIQALLKKFMVLDNPCKFALYKQTHRDGQALLQKLPQCDHPLLLRLIAGPDPDLLSFILKENETGEVEWHAFSVPELQNFLIILEKEEAERVRAVEQKYNNYRQKLQLALEQRDL